MKRNEEEYDKIISSMGELMKVKLRENEHKSHWEEMTVEELFTLLEKEVIELKLAIIFNEPQVNIVYEAADVANFAAFIIDNIRSKELKKIKTDKPLPPPKRKGWR